MKKIIQIGTGRASQFKQISEATSADECRAGAFLLKHRVRHDGGGMGQKRDIIDRHIVGGDSLLESGDDALTKVTRGGRRFRNTDCAIGVVDQRNVSECPPDIYSQTPCHESSSLVWAASHMLCYRLNRATLTDAFGSWLEILGALAKIQQEL